MAKPNADTLTGGILRDRGSKLCLSPDRTMIPGGGSEAPNDLPVNSKRSLLGRFDEVNDMGINVVPNENPESSTGVCFKEIPNPDPGYQPQTDGQPRASEDFCGSRTCLLHLHTVESAVYYLIDCLNRLILKFRLDA